MIAIVLNPVFFRMYCVVGTRALRSESEVGWIVRRVVQRGQPYDKLSELYDQPDDSMCDPCHPYFLNSK